MISDINTNLVPYFRDVISELQEFYNDEYAMFELLASGQIVDFMDLSQYSDFTNHLYNYGLIEKGTNNIPTIKLPVAAEYVAKELAKREGRASQYKLILNPDRSKWVKARIKTIINVFRQLENVIVQSQLPTLLGKHSIPEADKLSDIPVADTEDSFLPFINTLHKCLVESIESYGNSIRRSDYFWTDIQNYYPSLFSILYRIKVYRNSQEHLTEKLKQSILQDYTKFYAEDTKGFNTIPDKLFAIQQRLLDSLLLSINDELNRLV